MTLKLLKAPSRNSGYLGKDDMHRRQLLALAATASAQLISGAPKKDMIVRAARPEDLEMTLPNFRHAITPIENFFVRSHHYVPKVELNDWRLAISGQVTTPATFTMADLKKMPRVELVSVLECAGNGRALYEATVPGLQWEYGAVGNGRWAGVRLADVLRRCGIKQPAIEVLFDGADVPIGKMPEFKRTVPLNKALHPDTILAYEMNGEELPVAHGFPLRLIAPGWAGDSWVKWVTKIEVLDKEFDGFFMKTAYRHPGKNVSPGSAVDPAKMSPLTSLRIKSVIASHQDGAVVPLGPIKLWGVAWSGESPLSAVEVSTDNGRSWRPAAVRASGGKYGWSQWSYEWKPGQEAYYQVMARARSAGGDSQPFVPEWNPSGYAHNAVPTVGIDVANTPPASGLKPANPALTEPPAEFKSTCMVCHGSDVIEQQRLTRGQWEREVDKMVRWGADVKPEFRSQLVDFLSNRWGIRPRK